MGVGGLKLCQQGFPEIPEIISGISCNYRFTQRFHEITDSVQRGIQLEGRAIGFGENLRAVVWSTDPAIDW